MMIDDFTPNAQVPFVSSKSGSVETLVKSIDVRGIVFHNTPSCGIRQQTYTTTSTLFVEHFYRAQKA